MLKLVLLVTTNNVYERDEALTKSLCTLSLSVNYSLCGALKITDGTSR